MKKNRSYSIPLSLSGFDLDKTVECSEIGAKMHLFTHSKTGARVCFLDREDDCKTFAIGFPTIPTDDSGVFHIIEHSVLCGSKKYPIKAPFTEMMKGSLRTFMNAMTYSDMTIYPISTRNDKDFLNLTDTYLDAVFHPLAMEDERIFMQEGHRFESSPDGYTVNGVVYNEMKGAYASRDEYAAYLCSRHLFPGGTYSYDSGGEPDAIAELDYEQFKSSYRKFYHPSNAYVFLDGPIPFAETMELLDRYFSEFQRRTVDHSITAGKDPTEGVFEYEYEKDPSESERDGNLIILSKRITDFSQRERNFALGVISDCLADSNTSALKGAMLSSGLMADFHFYPEVSNKLGCFVAELVDVKDGCESKAIELYEKELSHLCQIGINEDQLEASINQYEFRVKEADYGRSPKGIAYMSAVYDGWMYGEDPEVTFRNNELFAALRGRIGSDYFKKLLCEINDKQGRVALILRPSTKLGKEKEETRRAGIAGYISSLSDKKREELCRSEEEFRLWQSTPDSEEDLCKIPRLTLEDLSEEPKNTPTRVSKIGSSTIIHHPIPTSGITYLTLLFDVSDLAAEYSSTLSLMCSVSGDMPTSGSSAQELRRVIKANLGSLYSSLMPIASKEGAKLYYTIRASFLDSKRETALDIINKHLRRSFGSPSVIGRKIKQIQKNIRDMLAYDGVSTAITRAAAKFSPLDALKENIYGYEYYLRLDEEKRDVKRLSAEMTRLKAMIFNKQRLTVSLTSEDADGFFEKVVSLVGGMKSVGEYTPTHAMIPTLPKKNDGIAIPATVADVAYVGSLFSVGDGKFTGAYSTLSTILSLELLEDEIRVKGGAYGAGFLARAASGAIGYYSFCDPSPQKSIEVFQRSGSLVRSFLSERKDLTPYVIGTVE